MTQPRVDLVALGVSCSVTGLSSPDAEALRSLWRPCLAGETPVDGLSIEVTRTADGWRAEGGGRWDLSGPDAAVAVASAAVNTAVTSRTPLLATHAAVVTRQGVTAVIPGSSGSGKSTLALALLRRGWSYASDEAFALDRATGEVRPYPRPMAVGDWTVRRLRLEGRGRPSGGETFLVPADVDAGYDLEPAVPRLIVLPVREPDVESVTAVHRMDGLEAVLRRSFTTHVDPPGALRLMAQVTRRCDVVRVSGPDPDATAAQLDDLF
jgi:hypothetical protein